LGEIRLGEMGLGEMGLGEMGQNRLYKPYRDLKVQKIRKYYLPSQYRRGYA